MKETKPIRNKEMSSKGDYSYEYLYNFIVKELNFLKSQRKIKSFCVEHALVYEMVINFKNGKLNYVNDDYAKLIVSLLAAFGYKATPIKSLSFKVEKSIK